MAQSWSFVGVNGGPINTGIAMPAGLQALDLCLLFSHGGNSLNLPGWTQLMLNSSPTPAFSVWTYVANGTETAVRDLGGASIRSALLVYRGLLATGIVSGSVASGTSASEITTASNDSMVLGHFTQSTNTYTASPPAAMTERYDASEGSSGWANHSVNDMHQATAGLTGSHYVSWSNTGGTRNAVLFAFTQGTPSAPSVTPDDDPIFFGVAL
jgi:hypothetical protein